MHTRQFLFWLGVRGVPTENLSLIKEPPGELCTVSESSAKCLNEELWSGLVQDWRIS